jgi:hypothetical protein
MNNRTRAQLEHDERQWARQHLADAVDDVAAQGPPARSIPPEQWEQCARFAGAYAAALEDPALQQAATPQLKRDARDWLYRELAHVVAHGYWPQFVDRESPLTETVAAFRSRQYGSSVTEVPITSLYNDDPHPVWSRKENLLFRFVHDYHHHVTGANDTFAGELTVTRHILTPQVRMNLPLARFLASEPVGQSSLFIQSGTYPRQIIAATILPLIPPTL